MMKEIRMFELRYRASLSCPSLCAPGRERARPDLQPAACPHHTEELRTNKEQLREVEQRSQYMVRADLPFYSTTWCP